MTKGTHPLLSQSRDKTGRGVGTAFSKGGALLKILADRRGAYLTGGANSRTRGKRGAFRTELSG